MGCYSFLQRIFPTQGSEPESPHRRQILYHLSYQGSSNLCDLVLLSVKGLFSASLVGWGLVFNNAGKALGTALTQSMQVGLNMLGYKQIFVYTVFKKRGKEMCVEGLHQMANIRLRPLQCTHPLS